jgi:hypothetical protein
VLVGHVARRLARYLDGQLDAKETRVVEGHLARCGRCRADLEAIRFAARAARELTRMRAPAAVWTDIERALSEPPVRSSLPVPWRWAAAALAALAVVGAATYWFSSRPAGPWEVTLAGGRTARMAVGAWLETPATSTARIIVGDIGTVDVEPATRVRLGVVGPQAYRLTLRRGTIGARITAPPRLFVVETPSSTLVDLGCAYVAHVDEAGAGTLRVTEGWVSLEWKGRESLVPAGAICRTDPATGPGTPYFEDAPADLQRALEAFDESGSSQALTEALAAARPRDTLSLWHLLPRVDPPAREQLFDRIAELVPPPPSVSREKALRLDPATLAHWREELAWAW